MNSHRFTLAGAALEARASGALWWPAEGVLCVADLHLGKSERMARRGGAMLPPYEAEDTLSRLEADLAATDATRVVCLGDSFDDCAAAEAADGALCDWLARLVEGRDWAWVAGNHDPAPTGLPGRHVAEMRLEGLHFRHIAEAGCAPGEISGHYHPKARLALGGASLSRPCFLIDARRVVLPAFGTYTGGLDWRAPEFAALMAPDARAVLTGAKAIALPMAAAAAMPRRQSPAPFGRHRF